MAALTIAPVSTRPVGFAHAAATTPTSASASHTPRSLASELPDAERGKRAAKESEIVVVDRAGERCQHRDTGERQRIGVKFVAGEAAARPSAEQRGEAECGDRNVDQAIRQQGRRMAFERRAR